MEIVQIVILGLTGLFLTLIGLMRLWNPKSSYGKNSGIQLSENVNLLNEIRGVSAVMLCSGMVIGLGAIVETLSMTSFVVGSIMFIGFAIGRLISIGVDGKPNSKLIQGIIFELVFGSAHLFGLFVLS